MAPVAMASNFRYILFGLIEVNKTYIKCDKDLTQIQLQILYINFGRLRAQEKYKRSL